MLHHVMLAACSVDSVAVVQFFASKFASPLAPFPVWMGSQPCTFADRKLSPASGTETRDVSTSGEARVARVAEHG